MSLEPKFGVYSFVSPVMGCAVYFHQDRFKDPCHSAEFDLAGRVISPEQYVHFRLTIPPHKIEGSKLTFLSDYEPKKITDFTPNIMGMDLPYIDKGLLAVHWDRLDILKLVVAEHPKVLVETNQHGTNLLHAAAAQNNTLSYLLSFSEIEVNSVNKSNFTPLLFAIMVNKIDNAKLIIQHGGKINGVSNGNRRAKSVFDYLVMDRYYTENDALKIINQITSR